MADDIWSGLVTMTTRTKRKLAARTLPPQAVVVHTTGGGIVAKALKADREPLTEALAWYSGPKAYSSGYLIGGFRRPGWDAQDDAIAGIVPDNLVALHAGVPAGNAALYARGRAVWMRHVAKGGALVDTGRVQERYSDWAERWPGAEGPADILRGHAKGVNARTLSLDVLAPEPGEPHSAQQLSWAAALVRDLLGRHGLPVSRTTVLRHSDVDPLSRTSPAGGWDPPTSAFRDILARLALPWA